MSSCPYTIVQYNRQKTTTTNHEQTAKSPFCQKQLPIRGMQFPFRICLSSVCPFLCLSLSVSLSLPTKVPSNKKGQRELFSLEKRQLIASLLLLSKESLSEWVPFCASPLLSFHLPILMLYTVHSFSFCLI